MGWPRLSGQPGRCSAWRLRRSRWCRTTARAFAGRCSRPRSPDRTRCCATSAPECDHPRPNGVIERWFGTLKYEHLFRGVTTDGDALDMEVHRFRVIYNTIRPRQALGDRTPDAAYTSGDQR
ncbi:integrase core domain-containing protein [Nocardia violaceofusca]|uniref:integrase core domain-containing protein n=1 Tax=Nocardia violaceofusca TaxID=941182 RepID=UPI0022B6E665|nr:integrase core domain-containing protein [Nocardia violaceofusca]